MGSLCSTCRSAEAPKKYTETLDSILLKLQDVDEEKNKLVYNLTCSYAADDVIIDSIARGLDAAIADKTELKVHNLKIELSLESLKSNFEKADDRQLLLEFILSVLMANHPDVLEFVEKYSSLLK